MGKAMCEFVGSRGVRHWAVGRKEGFLEAGILRNEGDGNLPEEGEGGGGEAASTANELLGEDQEYEMPLYLAGEGSGDNEKSIIVRTFISNGDGKSITIGFLDVW